MNIYLDCIPCFVRQSLDAARNATDDVEVHEEIIRHVLRLAAELDLNRPPPWVSRLIHRRLRELTGVADPYQGVKSRYNRLALSMLGELRERVKSSPDPLMAAAEVAMAANVIDLGVKSSLNEVQAAEVLRDAGSIDIHGDVDEFKRRVKEAKNILYLADNAGEIAIDKLLIEVLGPKRVTVVVRGNAVINDATMDDAREVGMCELVQVIDNGSDAPGTILDDCSAEFKEHFLEADLIISKGQGNYETLSGEDANLVFLFKVKCSLIAHHANLPLGVHALLTNHRS